MTEHEAWVALAYYFHMEAESDMPDMLRKYVCYEIGTLGDRWNSPYFHRSLEVITPSTMHRMLRRVPKRRSYNGVLGVWEHGTRAGSIARRNFCWRQAQRTKRGAK